MAAEPKLVVAWPPNPLNGPSRPPQLTYNRANPSTILEEALIGVAVVVMQLLNHRRQKPEELGVAFLLLHDGIRPVDALAQLEGDDRRQHRSVPTLVDHAAEAAGDLGTLGDLLTSDEALRE